MDNKNNIDTIAAIATGLSTAAVSIVRLSGDNALSIAADIFTPVLKRPGGLEPYRLYPGLLKGRGFSDQCMCVVFKGPKSYTGEDSAEFHCHGGLKLTESVLKEVISRGARLAENGEFTKRAFLNGKLDLSAAEGIIDLINAQSEAELNAGYSLLSGRLKDNLTGLQNKLTAMLAEIDAAADYPDEYDGTDLEKRVTGGVYDTLKNLKELQKTYSDGAIIKNGINCAIIGMPNTGKSSLMNALLNYDRSIVTNEAGTTRDTVSESFTHNGVRINLVDTAGIRRAKNNAENLGVERSKTAAAAADIALYVQDYDSKTIPSEFSGILKDKKHIFVINKIDEAAGYNKPAYAKLNKECEKDRKIYISAKKGLFTDELKALIIKSCLSGNYAAGGLLLSNFRHFEAVTRAAASLAEYLAADPSTPLEMRYVDIKAAWDALGQITGATASEEIIDTLFASFCVGK